MQDPQHLSYLSAAKSTTCTQSIGVILLLSGGIVTHTHSHTHHSSFGRILLCLLCLNCGPLYPSSTLLIFLHDMSLCLQKPVEHLGGLKHTGSSGYNASGTAPVCVYLKKKKEQAHRDTPLGGVH